MAAWLFLLNLTCGLDQCTCVCVYGWKRQSWCVCECVCGCVIHEHECARPDQCVSVCHRMREHTDYPGVARRRKRRRRKRREGGFEGIEGWEDGGWWYRGEVVCVAVCMCGEDGAETRISRDARLILFSFSLHFTERRAVCRGIPPGPGAKI